MSHPAYATSLTAETITDDQIQQLSDEAAQAGDGAQVDICERALGGDDEARASCAEAINDARAMLDDEF